MSITINGLTISALKAQPFAYEADEVRQGLVARTWEVSGLLNSSELANLKSIFDTWRAARITDPDSLESNTVGTTVALSASANGLTASGVNCWFTEAPSFEQVGAYVQTSFKLVDAAEALAVAKRRLEKSSSAEQALKPAYGTLSLGGVTITLTEHAETLEDLPTLERTSAGYPYLSGPLSCSRVRSIQGTVAAYSDFTTLFNWVISQSGTTPSTGDWYPTSPPTATAEVKIVGGLKTTQWTVSLNVKQV
ncbi:MAG: hypothetical protein ACO28M_01950 [Vulcanococcus sp.]